MRRFRQETVSVRSCRYGAFRPSLGVAADWRRRGNLAQSFRSEAPRGGRRARRSVLYLRALRQIPEPFRGKVTRPLYVALPAPARVNDESVLVHGIEGILDLLRVSVPHRPADWDHSATGFAMDHFVEHHTRVRSFVCLSFGDTHGLALYPLAAIAAFVGGHFGSRAAPDLPGTRRGVASRQAVSSLEAIVGSNRAPSTGDVGNSIPISLRMGNRPSSR